MEYTKLTDETLDVIEAGLDIAEIAIGYTNDDRIESMSRIQETLGKLEKFSEKELGTKAVEVLTTVAVTAELALLTIKVALEGLEANRESYSLFASVERLSSLSNIWGIFMEENLPQVRLAAELIGPIVNK